MKNNQKR